MILKMITPQRKTRKKRGMNPNPNVNLMRVRSQEDETEGRVGQGQSPQQGGERPCQGHPKELVDRNLDQSQSPQYDQGLIVKVLSLTPQRSREKIVSEGQTEGQGREQGHHRLVHMDAEGQEG